MVGRRAKLRKRFSRFKEQFIKTVSRIKPIVAFRILGGIVIFFPGLALSILMSLSRTIRWRKLETCKKFLLHHSLAFENVLPDSLTVRSVSGGLSNSNQIWYCKKKSGEDVTYFVKIFLSAGSFWAKRLSFVSPFPAIYAGKTHERFTTDMVSRVQLSEYGVSVPRLVAYDAVEKVMVAEHISGRNVDAILQRIGRRGKFLNDEKEVIRQSAIGLARAHRAGFSLIDTQPINCIWVSGEKKVYFTDLEFCTREDTRLWDIGFFLCFIAVRLTSSIRQTARDIFLENYKKEQPLDSAALDRTAETLQSYMPVFQAILDIRQFTPEELFEGLISA